jgi:hypothetical protein
MKEYYVLYKMDSQELIRLGRKVKDVKGLEGKFAEYEVEKSISGNSFFDKNYKRAYEIRIDKIVRFESDQRALLWFKLNY